MADQGAQVNKIVPRDIEHRKGLRTTQGSQKEVMRISPSFCWTLAKHEMKGSVEDIIHSVTMVSVCAKYIRT
jgi:hypothetical protein